VPSWMGCGPILLTWLVLIVGIVVVVLIFG
jgi:hypothetical protein